MTLVEKLYSIFAVLFVLGLFTVLFLYPQMRQLNILLPVSLIGVGINIGLIFIVLRDAFYRRFANPTGKYIWICVILFFWPAILYYLPKYGFRKR